MSFAGLAFRCNFVPSNKNVVAIYRNKLCISLFILSILHFVTMSINSKTDNRLYELQIYHSEAGKLPELILQFKNHITKLFEKHGIFNVGYWKLASPDSSSLYCILSYPDLAHREASRKEFENDEGWKKVGAVGETNGKLVQSVESIYLDPEDFTPEINESIKTPERLFELRIYTPLPNKLNDLERRMGDHTLKLFASHGMTNIAYWKTHEKDSTAMPKFIYILAHASEAAAAKSWAEFRQDPKWIALRDSSEKNGKIVDNIKSTFLKPLEFSKYK